jgi:hypothetical protein
LHPTNISAAFFFSLFPGRRDLLRPPQVQVTVRGFVPTAAHDTREALRIEAQKNGAVSSGDRLGAALGRAIHRQAAIGR